MTRIRKGLSLLAVAAFLITALLPVSGLAAPGQTWEQAFGTGTTSGSVTTYTLDGPVTVTSRLTAPTATSTLKLNGQTVKSGAGFDDAIMIVVPNGATLNVEGTGQIEAPEIAIAVRKGGTVNLNGGTIIGGNAPSDTIPQDDPSYPDVRGAVQTGAIGEGAKATLNVNAGATIKGRGQGIAVFAESNITINGGTVEGGTGNTKTAERTAIFYQGNASGSTLIVNDGSTISNVNTAGSTAMSSAIAWFGSKGADGKCQLNGGSLSSKNGPGLVVRSGEASVAAGVSISVDGVAVNPKTEGDSGYEIPSSPIVWDTNAPSYTSNADCTVTVAEGATLDPPTDDVPAMAHVTGSSSAPEWNKPDLAFTASQGVAFDADGSPVPSGKTLTASTSGWNWTRNMWKEQYLLYTGEESATVHIPLAPEEAGPPTISTAPTLPDTNVTYVVGTADGKIGTSQESMKVALGAKDAEPINATNRVTINGPSASQLEMGTDAPDALLVGATPATVAYGPAAWNPEAGAPQASGPINYTWESSDETIATVSADGKVTPLAPGTTTISVTAAPPEGGSWTVPPASAAAATAEKEVTVYEFGLQSGSATAVVGDETTVSIVPAWNPGPQPVGAVVTPGTPTAATLGDNPVPTTYPTSSGLTISVPEGTDPGVYTYNVEATLNGTTATAPFVLTVYSKLGEAVTNDPNAPNNPVKSEGVPDPEDPGKVSYEVTLVSDGEAPGEDEATYTGTQKLQVSVPEGATIEWTVENGDGAVVDESDTASVAIPAVVGTYVMTATVTAGGETMTVTYNVTVEGNLGQATGPGSTWDTSASAAPGQSVALYPSWTNGAAPQQQPAAPGQTVSWQWELLNLDNTPADPDSPAAVAALGTLEQADTETPTYVAPDEIPAGRDVLALVQVACYAGSGAARAGRTLLGKSQPMAINAGSFVVPGTGVAGNYQYNQQVATVPEEGTDATNFNGLMPGREYIGDEIPPQAWQDVAFNNNVGSIPVAAGSRIGADDRFEIRVNGEWKDLEEAGNEISFEWHYRTSANAGGGNGIAISPGMGFYGLNSRTLVSGPVTTDMDGWQFCLVARRKVGAQIEEKVSPWFLLNVEKASSGEVPVVQIESAPANSASAVPVTQTADVTFTATVTNGLPDAALSYRWETRVAPTAASPDPQWTTVAGGTGRTLTIENVRASQNGDSYRCVVTNNAFSTGINGESNILTLSVSTRAGAVIISSPTASSLRNLYASRTATFSVTARTDNGDDVTYQWFRKGVPGPVKVGGYISTAAGAAEYLANAPATAVTGATDAEYTTPALEEGVYEYVCRVTNAKDSARTLNSNGFYLVVTRQSRVPVITEPATGVVTPKGTPAGEAVTMRCVATAQSQEALSYQWQASREGDVWSNLQNQTGPDFTLPNPSGADSGWYYRCVVTNAAAGETTVSAPYRLTVWNSADVPVPGAIAPRTVEGPLAQFTASTDDDPPAVADAPPVRIASSASAPSGDVLTATWYHNGKPFSGWTSLGVNPLTVAAVEGATTGTWESAIEVDLKADSDARAALLNGTWFCRWTNTNAGITAADGWTVPTRDSGSCVVGIVIPGSPVITVQPVEKITGAVGTTAIIEVGAVLNADPDASPQGGLVYVWQRSEDGGRNWRNCTSADGSGQFTRTFSVPLTATMYDNATAANVQGFANPYTYRVVVANSAYGPGVVSGTAALTITPASEPGTQPVIKVVDGADVEISDNAELGRILMGAGLTATKDGHPASALLAMVEADPGSENCGIRVVDADGNVLEDDAVVGTGCELQLVDAADGDRVLDTVTVIVRGDVTGTGRISLTQLVRMAAAYRQSQAGGEQTELEGVYLLAGDLAGSDSEITLTDLVREASLYRKEVLEPGAEPTAEPTASPTAEPTAEPTASQTVEPTAEPTATVSPEATVAPTGDVG